MLKREPLVKAAILRLGLAVAGAFGLELTAEQVVGVLGVVEAVSTWWSRRRVTPITAPEPAYPAGV